MAGTQFKVKDIFGDIVYKDTNNQDQSIKLDNF